MPELPEACQAAQPATAPVSRPGTCMPATEPLQTTGRPGTACCYPNSKAFPGPIPTPPQRGPWEAGKGGALLLTGAGILERHFGGRCKQCSKVLTTTTKKDKKKKETNSKCVCCSRSHCWERPSALGVAEC